MARPPQSFREAVFERRGKALDSALNELRNETSELEARLSGVLEALFGTPVLVWDEWLLSTLESLQCRTALGIPTYLKTDDLVRVLGTRTGFSRTIRDATACRIDRILTQLIRLLSHPLCAGGLSIYLDNVKSIRASLAEPDGTPYHPVSPNHVLELLKDYFEAGNPKEFKPEKKRSKRGRSNKERSAEVRSDLRSDLLQAYYVSFFNPASYILLQATDDIMNDAFHRLSQGWDGRCADEREDPWEQIRNLVSHCSVFKEDSEELEADSAAKHGIPFVPLWFFVESAKVCDEVEDLVDDTGETGYTLRRTNSFFRCVYDSVSQLRPLSNRIGALGGLLEFIEYDSTLLHLVSAAMTHYGLYHIPKRGQYRSGKTQQKLENSLHSLAFLRLLFQEEHRWEPRGESRRPRKTRRGKVPGLFWLSDHGHLYFLALRLWAALEFWQWDSLFLLRDRRGSNKLNWRAYPGRDVSGAPKWTAPIYKLVDDVHELRELNDRDEKSNGGVKITPVRDSVMLLGGAGMGKSTLLQWLYCAPWHVEETRLRRILRDEDGVDPCINLDLDDEKGLVVPWVVKKTPPELAGRHSIPSEDDFRVQVTVLDEDPQTWENSPVEPRFLVYFVDEVHLAEKAPGDVFGKLLVPLEDGYRVRVDDTRELEVHFVFATSKYRTRHEFIAEATRSKNVSMRDFATRIGKWVELPSLMTVPEQRAALAWAYNADDKKSKEERIEAHRRRGASYLDMARKSARELKQARDSYGTHGPAEDERIRYYFPKMIVSRLPGKGDVVEVPSLNDEPTPRKRKNTPSKKARSKGAPAKKAEGRRAGSKCRSSKSKKVKGKRVGRKRKSTKAKKAKAIHTGAKRTETRVKKTKRK